MRFSLERVVAGVILKDQRYLVCKRPKNKRHGNLWEFPGGRLEPGETPEMALVLEYAEETELQIGKVKRITTVQHSYTIYRVTLHCYFCSLMDGQSVPVLHGAQEYRWVSPEELSHYAFPAGHRKFIDHLKKTDIIF